MNNRKDELLHLLYAGLIGAVATASFLIWLAEVYCPSKGIF